jgi:hypothetical protein
MNRLNFAIILFVVTGMLISCTKSKEAESSAKPNTFVIEGNEYPVMLALYLEDDAGDVYRNDSLDLSYKRGVITFAGFSQDQGVSFQVEVVQPGPEITSGRYNFVNVDSSNELETNGLAAIAFSEGNFDGGVPSFDDIDVIIFAEGYLEINSITDSTIDLSYDLNSAGKNYNGAYSGVMYSGQ